MSVVSVEAFIKQSKLGKDHSLWPLVIETDALDVITLFNTDTNKHSNIVNECRLLMTRIQLIIKYCKLLDKLCISGTVKSVLFADCDGLEEIDLQATNLCGFECLFDNKETHFPTEMQIFGNLRMLALLFESTFDFEIVKVFPVLDICPVLQYLDILQHKTYGQKARGSHTGSPLSPTDHTELKEVRFGGFHGTKEEIELATYILRSAMIYDLIFRVLELHWWSFYQRWSIECMQDIPLPIEEQMDRSSKKEPILDMCKKHL
ncbi:hypothetical protein BC332_05649 [Capsicum chinense]|nr:hypothetical protein BC332_05649 [Capsicum chinense]